MDEAKELYEEKKIVNPSVSDIVLFSTGKPAALKNLRTVNIIKF